MGQHCVFARSVSPPPVIARNRVTKQSQEIGLFIRDCFAEPVLNAMRFFATLRMTRSEGLAMTRQILTFLLPRQARRVEGVAFISFGEEVFE